MAYLARAFRYPTVTNGLGRVSLGRRTGRRAVTRLRGVRPRGNYLPLAGMGEMGFVIPPQVISLLVGTGSSIFGKLLFSGGKGHKCSKTATDPESFLACWPYHPIPDNYIPCYQPPGKSGWDWCFYLGASGGRPNPNQDPNLALNDQEIQAWQARGIPLSCGNAGGLPPGVCKRLDCGGQTLDPNPAGCSILGTGGVIGAPTAGSPAASTSLLSTTASGATAVTIGGFQIPVWGLALGGLGLLMFLRR